MKPQTGKVRCIDIERYNRSHNFNRKVIDIMVDGVIEITEIYHSAGFINQPGFDTNSSVISGGEWKYFEPVSKYPNPPHKHCEVIKAWADGAEIEHNSKLYHMWKPVERPSWASGAEYRIKPQKSEKDIQIEKLEEQAKQLAIDIAKLKET